MKSFEWKLVDSPVVPVNQALVGCSQSVCMFRNGTALRLHFIGAALYGYAH